MSRQLRPRKGRPSYLDSFDTDEDQNQAGPSTISHVDESGPESDFVLDREAEKAEEEILEEIGEEEPVEVLEKPIKKPRKPSLKGKGKAGVSRSETAPRSSKRAPYSLPTPAVHHRHRAVPLFSRPGRVERLSERPKLFHLCSVTLTNAFTKTSDRVTKSWGFNVGPGPLWDLIEDRGWFKEAEVTGNDVDSEAKRRPRVYQDICVKEGWELLTEKDAAPYLPTNDAVSADGIQNRSAAMQCYFGRITSQRRRETKMFDSFAMLEYISESKAHILNAGAPVWGLDWCPIHPDGRAERSYKKYLAIGPFPSSSHSPEIGEKVERPAYACVQIWSLAPTQNLQEGSKKNGSRSKPDDVGEMKCEMVLCLDTGPAYDLKWCPLPSHDLKSDNKEVRKLGLLGGTFEDGSFSIYVVPDPDDIKSNNSGSLPIFVRLPQPILRIELEDASSFSVDWANSSTLAIGTTNGNIAVYSIGSTLQTAAASDHPVVTDLLPTHYLTVHQSAIRAIAWIRAPQSWPSGKSRYDQDPTVIASAGYDGVECLTDLREGRGAIMNRTRDVINAISYSPFSSGPITMDGENTVKAYSASPGMLGRGHSLLEPKGSVWSVDASDYHPQLAVASADGSCSTTNLLRSTRRGGSVPFLDHKIYQMDYNRQTKEFRMLEQFFPQEIIDRPSVTRAAKAMEKNDADKAHPATVIPVSSGAWPQQVGIHRVVWNNGNGLGSSTLLASATASGLCRVDCLFGRWHREKLPYGGIEAIRMEGKRIADEEDEDMIVDENDDDDDEDGLLDAEGEGEDEDEEM